MKGSLLTYEEVGVVGDVVAEHDETVLAVVNAKLHLGVDSKVLLSLNNCTKSEHHSCKILFIIMGADWVGTHVYF